MGLDQLAVLFILKFRRVRVCHELLMIVHVMLEALARGLSIFLDHSGACVGLLSCLAVGHGCVVQS
jgi:hypothetical protein